MSWIWGSSTSSADAPGSSGSSGGGGGLETVEDTRTFEEKVGYRYLRNIYYMLLQFLLLHCHIATTPTAISIATLLLLLLLLRLLLLFFARYIFFLFIFSITTGPLLYN